MLNLALGSTEDINGRATIVTRKGASGHAVYGPYDLLPPGNYVVEFHVEPAGDEVFKRDFQCVILDVAIGIGAQVLARKDILYSQLRAGRTSFALSFRLKQEAQVEYRAWVTGDVSLRIDGHRRVMPVPAGDPDGRASLADGGFPDASENQPPFFRDHAATFRRLYEQGVGVRIQAGAVVLSVGGVSFYARQLDDLNFIGEVFFEGAYNIKSDRPLCVIDIGMNIGLTSLLLSSKGEVAEVHAFEPFANTYDRAVDNIGLNPALAGKIDAHNVGLSDRNSEGSVLVSSDADSGAMSAVGQAGGAPVHVVLRDAGDYLRPIIASAVARKLDVLVKLDCEGSEFAIFESLERKGLLGRISAFMVEWHRMFPGKSQDTLIEPLRRAGFLVFDRSPPGVNGFFYAVKLGPPAAD